MVTTPTTHYHFGKPELDGSADTWGQELNGALDAVDGALFTVDTALSNLDGRTRNAAPTGAVMDFMRTSPPTGWLVLNGDTIGNGGTIASARADADCWPLFELLWQQFSFLEVYNGFGPGARGGSAAGDWGEGKCIALPDQRGRFRRALGGASEAIGVQQTDAFQGFAIKFDAGSGSGSNQIAINIRGDLPSKSAQVFAPQDNGYGTPRMAGETRPSNIAYLTCIKL